MTFLFFNLSVTIISSLTSNSKISVPNISSNALSPSLLPTSTWKF